MLSISDLADSLRQQDLDLLHRDHSRLEIDRANGHNSVRKVGVGRFSAIV
jgi:hypothetical protein